MTDIVWQNVNVTLGQLQPWERNPKSISKAHAKRLLASWDKFGQFQTVAIGPGFEVYDGHQRLSVLRAAYGDGYSVAARQSSRELSDAERRELVIAAHVGTTGQFNWDELANWDAAELQDWGLDGEQLQDWKTSIGALTELIEAAKEEPPEDPGAQIDKADELREKWGVESGQLWKLGEHRLIVGDSLETETINRLMQGEKADLVVTDPPYAIYGSSTGIGGDVTDNNMVRPFMRDVAMLIEGVARIRAHAYVFCDWRSYATWWDEIKKRDLIIRNVIVWDKGDGGLGSNYTMRHEFVVMCECMTKSITVNKSNREGKHRNVNGLSNVQRFNVPQGDDRKHNAAKPPDLLAVFIRASSDEGDIVIDPFCGSGTTMIVCEQLKRKCRTIEINENYAAVAIERWHVMTGQEPELITAN